MMDVHLVRLGLWVRGWKVMWVVVLRVVAGMDRLVPWCSGGLSLKGQAWSAGGDEGGAVSGWSLALRMRVPWVQ